MSRRNPVYSPYRQAQINARRRVHALSIESLRRVDRSIETFADDLTRVLGTLPEGESARQSALARALQIIQTRVRVRLRELLQVAVSTGRQTSFDAILGIQTDATLAVARATDIPNNLLGAVRVPKVTMAGAWESLGTGSATWKTLLSRYSDGAVDDVQRVVTVAMTAGVSPDELAKRLRPYVRGAETLPEAMKGAEGLSDRDLAQLLNTPATAQSAKTLRHNAARIAFSEVHNARGEAEVQAFAADPFVNAVRWTLSPNRGTQTEPDVCDALADSDFYGLGKGVYPVTKVPVSPHPWDRCERVPVTRPLSEVDRPKPDPDRVLPFAEAKVRGSDTMIAQDRERIIRQVGNVFVTTAGSGSPLKLDALANQAAVAGMVQ